MSKSEPGTGGRLTDKIKHDLEELEDRFKETTLHNINVKGHHVK